MVIDFHSHILPNCDHGSTSVDMSLRQLAAAKNAGVDIIVATPHFYLDTDTVDDFCSRREDCFNSLKENIKDKPFENIKILKGAEVTLKYGLDELPDLKSLCVEGTDTILIEMPMATTWTDWMFRALYGIMSKHRLKPIIAHVDRYPAKEVEKLMKYDIPFQINAVSLTKFSTRGRILKYVRDGYVEALGSDMHLDGKMYAYYKKALKVLDTQAEDIMENSAVLIGIKKRQSLF